MNLDKYSIADPVDWCERNITLDYGRFKRENHPLMIEPLRAISGMKGGIVGLIGSVQHIKTLTAQLWQLYSAQVEPTRSAMYDLTEQALKEFSDDKFTPLIDGTDAILGLIPKQAYRRTKFYTSMPFGSIRLLSAKILANRNSKTLERISCDESWAYETNWLDQIQDRMASYPWSWQLFLPSSGQTAGSDLDEFWKRSTQKVWHIPCDCCGEMIPYIWTPGKQGEEMGAGGMRWGAKEDICHDDGSINHDALRDSIYYECQKCGGKMRPDLGRTAERNLKGRYIQTNESGDPKLDFYHYNALAHFPWSDLVEQWLKAGIDRDRGNLKGIENFIRKRLAEPWNEGSFVSGDENVENSGPYDLGEVWESEGESFKFCTVDVQKDHFYFVIRDWRIVNGVLRSRLLERGKVMSSTEIREACDKWKIPQAGLNEEIGCRVFLDGNYNTIQVQRIACQNGWMVFRGDNAKDYRHPDGIRRMYSDIQFIDIGEGTVNSGQRWVGQFAFSNNQAMNRLSLIRSIKDNHGQPVWTHAINAGSMYVKQLNAWAKIRREKQDGSAYFDWIQRFGHDHFHDCEKMQLVCASMANLVGTDHVEKQEVDNLVDE